MNAEKLAKLQAQVRIGGKGTPRRKVKKVVKSIGADDKKLQGTLKKLNCQPIGSIEEVNMFKDNGEVIHFTNPKGVQSLLLKKASWVSMRSTHRINTKLICVSIL